MEAEEGKMTEKFKFVCFAISVGLLLFILFLSVS